MEPPEVGLYAAGDIAGGPTPVKEMDDFDVSVFLELNILNTKSMIPTTF